MDHVSPTSRGGADDESNLALACRSCNAFKSGAVLAAEGPLFNPRVDRWAEHFAIAEDNVVVGITAAGRATVAALRINGQRQVAARAFWRLLGLFP